MIELLASWDKGLFFLINHTLANPVFDFIMPALTDWNKSVVGWILAGGAWLALMIRGGKKGRIVGVALLVVVGVCDQLNSHLLKHLFARARPCQEGLAGLRLLVDCGSGYSFPSSHAVNNTALAVVLARFYARWKWIFALYAFLMCLSRVVVGVHYPFDVLGGAILGAALGYAMAVAFEFTVRRFPLLRIEERE